MNDAYNLNIENDYIAMMKSWHEADPVSPWEIQRDKRIQSIRPSSLEDVKTDKLYIR